VGRQISSSSRPSSHTTESGGSGESTSPAVLLLFRERANGTPEFADFEIFEPG
jgi:hypothetical protein